MSSQTAGECNAKTTKKMHKITNNTLAKKRARSGFVPDGETLYARYSVSALTYVYRSADSRGRTYRADNTDEKCPDKQEIHFNGRVACDEESCWLLVSRTLCALHESTIPNKCDCLVAVNV